MCEDREAVDRDTAPSGGPRRRPTANGSRELTWVVAVVVPIVVAVLSALASWQIATITIERALDREFLEGTSVFKSVGHRYFAAIYRLYEQSDTGNYVPVSDDTAWKAYRRILTDMSEDIAWLRRNPSYGRIHADLFPHIQNFLVEESLSVAEAPNKRTLNAMCQLYIDEKLWPIPAYQERHARDVYEFATRLCECARRRVC